MIFTPKIIPSNEYWGRRSGGWTPAPKGGTKMLGFMQVSFGVYRPRTGAKPPALTTINVPKKWFKKRYKSKRGSNT
jgi:hypothetical protein